jgi:hypothetical protein
MPGGHVAYANLEAAAQETGSRSPKLRNRPRMLSSTSRRRRVRTPSHGP